MGKVTKKEKIKILAGAATAATSYRDMNTGDEFDAAVNRELQAYFTKVLVMFLSDYITDGDEKAAIELMGSSAAKTLIMCEKNANVKSELKVSAKAVDSDELKKVMGPEAFAKFEAFMNSK